MFGQYYLRLVIVSCALNLGGVSLI